MLSPGWLEPIGSSGSDKPVDSRRANAAVQWPLSRRCVASTSRVDLLAVETLSRSRHGEQASTAGSYPAPVGDRRRVFVLIT